MTNLPKKEMKITDDSLARYLRLAVYISFALAIPACDLSSPAVRPALPVPENYAVQLDDTENEGVKDFQQLRWQDFYADPELQGLIASALENNRHLLLAALKVEELKARYKIQTSAQWPKINAEVDVVRSHSPQKGEQSPGTSTQSEITLGSVFELDFFFRKRNASRIAKFEFLASDAEQKAVRNSFIATVAKTYFSMQAWQQNAKVTENIQKNYEKTLDLQQQLLQHGLSSRADLDLLTSAAAHAKLEASKARQQWAQAKNDLHFLLGRTEELNLGDELRQNWPFELRLPENLSATVLLNRPEIIAAEHKLQAAHANIHIARAAFFPKINLTTSVGSVSNKLGGLFENGTWMWSIGPEMLVTVFDFGVRKNQMKLAKIKKEQAIVEYQQAIQQTFYDVLNVISKHQSLKAQLQAANTETQARERYARDLRASVVSGYARLADQLEAERNHQTSKQNQIQIQAAYLASYAEVYHALGGEKIE